MIELPSSDSLSSTSVTPLDTAARIKSLAIEMGFQRAGIAPAAPLEHGSYYRNWLDAGHAGTMDYLRRSAAVRDDPRHLLPGAKSVVCVALQYAAGDDPPASVGTPSGRVARYARGRDYHTVMRRMLDRLAARMREVIEAPFRSQACVDTMPVLEKELARVAGLGWMGKNTLLLNRELGSYLFLGELVTTLALPSDQPVTDHCGSCTRCLDACPTRAFPAPYQLDATRCISYLTIEHRGEIPSALHAGIGDWVFGCDICQEVCPFNADPASSSNPALAASQTPARIPLEQLARLTSGDYRRLTRDSALRRASVKMLRRNAAIAIVNAAQDPAAHAAT
ncbi:MAG: tRNA epoxyqueuosine(34) reductase QueG [Phycisphaerae bacterium]